MNVSATSHHVYRLFFQHPFSVSEFALLLRKMERIKRYKMVYVVHGVAFIAQITSERFVIIFYSFQFLLSFFLQFLVSIFTGIVVNVFTMYECIVSRMANECLYQLKPNSKCVVLSNGWMNVFNCVKWAFSLFPSSCHLKGGYMNVSRRRKKK